MVAHDSCRLFWKEITYSDTIVICNPSSAQRLLFATISTRNGSSRVYQVFYLFFPKERRWFTASPTDGKISAGAVASE
jgi:hypothetical protein